MSEVRLEMHLIAHGRVQGVGFRWHVVQQATQLGLVGTVENLPDGSVEVFAQGPTNQLKKLALLLQNDIGSASVERIQVEFNDPTNSYKEFIILRD